MPNTYRGFNADSYELLCVSSIRRLWHKRQAQDARKSLRQWISDLRTLRAMVSECSCSVVGIEPCRHCGGA